MTAQIESRLRKLEAARQPDSPLADFTVAELQAIRRELDDNSPGAVASPLLKRAAKAMFGSDEGGEPTNT